MTSEPHSPDGRINKLSEFLRAGLGHVLRGSRRYYAWMGGLSGMLLLGLYTFYLQKKHGLIITSARHLNPWGTLTYAQFPFFVGVAAGAVMIVIPAHLYHRDDFEEIAIFGEALAASAVIVSIASVLTMLGSLLRLVYIFPIVGTPNFPWSMLTWDVIVLNGYLALNIFIPGYVLYKIYHGEETHRWLRYVIYLSIPWAISIHTVTAFIIVANQTRHLWYTALMVPRFLTSAFVVGPALMILILMAMRRLGPDDAGFTGIDIEDRTFHTMAQMILIALFANLFSIMSEIFTLGYAQTVHWSTMKYLLFGLEHHGEVYNMLTPLMWLSIGLELGAALLLLHPKTRYDFRTLAIGAGAAIGGVFIEKGLILFLSVFIISPLGQVYEPNFTVPEVVMAISLWALGALVFTVLIKAAIGIRRDRATSGEPTQNPES
ncbi:MAG: Ni/Fe-hydrogenase subunit HybB-like protein [Halobacteriales archaeon]|jgi:Ni/Fe-hydrogenase subunit HybB-like protein